MKEPKGEVPKGQRYMNFRVLEDFHKEFKVIAAEDGISMTELLYRSLEAYKKQRPTTKKRA